MQIGRKIYYGKSNGIVIWDKGEMENAVETTTTEDDKNVMPILSMINSEEIGICQLNYGDYSEEFKSSIAWKINIDTGIPEFIF